MQRSNTTLSRPRTTGRERKVTVISVRGATAMGRRDSEVRANNMSDVRLQRVISEINEFQTRSEDQLMKDTTKKAKQLLWFFSLFTVYVMFGIFLFFYIEECSGASRPKDDSVLHEDVVEYPKIKNATQNCLNIYKALIVSKRANNVSRSSDVRIEDFANTTFSFETFRIRCSQLLEAGLKPVVKEKAKVPECVVTEYKLLKYAEFVVFTLLLIGYGNTTPQTVAGRYSIIAYAIIGIPLGLTMYSIAGKLLVQLITFLVRKFESVVLKNKVEVRYMYIKTFVVGIVFLLLLMMTGSLVTTSSSMENLDATSSIYFWFVTWSTIGYGDITFHRDRHLQSPHLMLIAVFNLLFGLGMYVAIIEALSTAMVKQEKDDEDDGVTTADGLKDLNASTFFLDRNGNVNEDSANKKLSEDQQSRIHDALRNYQKIKDSASAAPSPIPQSRQSPTVFTSRDIRRLSSTNERKAGTLKMNGTAGDDSNGGVTRSISKLSFTKNNEGFDYANTDV